jgi:predicted TIM-barrel fold metal-dependent hydrolase
VTFTVDTHHHILPDFFFQATNETGHPAGGVAPAPWSRASMLSFLDEAGVDVAVTSISTPGVHTGDDAAARALARRCNELAAEMVHDRPDRFGGFACLPLPDVDGALAELAYAVDDLRLDGVVLFSNARGIYLGDSRFTPAVRGTATPRRRRLRAPQPVARPQRTSSPGPRPARPRPRRSATCTGIPLRPGATPCCACCAT